jgi:hypothetical protein
MWLVLMCAWRQLLLTNALETEELDPPKQWVPWLTINGRVRPLSLSLPLTLPSPPPLPFLPPSLPLSLFLSPKLWGP